MVSVSAQECLHSFQTELCSGLSDIVPSAGRRSTNGKTGKWASLPLLSCAYIAAWQDANCNVTMFQICRGRPLVVSHTFLDKLCIVCYLRTNLQQQQKTGVHQLRLIKVEVLCFCTYGWAPESPRRLRLNLYRQSACYGSARVSTQFAMLFLLLQHALWCLVPYSPPSLW